MTLSRLLAAIMLACQSISRRNTGRFTDIAGYTALKKTSDLKRESYFSLKISAPLKL